MSKNSDWQPGLVRRNMRNGQFDFVKGYVFKGVFCAYRYTPKMKYWNVMHVPSGLAMSTNLSLFTLRRAKEYATRCYDLLPPSEWALTKPDVGNPKIWDAAARLRQEFRDPL